MNYPLTWAHGHLVSARVQLWCLYVYLSMASMNSSFDMGVLNIPQVPSTAAFCPSSEVAAVQSLSVTTLKPLERERERERERDRERESRP